MQDRRAQPASLPIEEWRRLAAEGDFEEALDALEQVAAQLNRGEVSLQQSIDCYETGKALHARCQALLAQAQARIEQAGIAPANSPESRARAMSEDVDGMPF